MLSIIILAGDMIQFVDETFGQADENKNSIQKNLCLQQRIVLVSKVLCKLDTFYHSSKP